MEAWPRSCWTERMSAPLERRSVAKTWRSTWGVTFFVMPALIAHFLMMSSIERGVRRDGAVLLVVTFTKSASDISLRAERYAETAHLAAGGMKTTRTLSPLPRTEQESWERSRTQLSGQSSETR